MVFLRMLLFPAFCAAALLALADCAGGGLNPNAAPLPLKRGVSSAGRSVPDSVGASLSPLVRKTSLDLVYVSDFLNNVVNIYPEGQQNPVPIGRITDGISGPEGSFVDAADNLYVSNVTNYTVTRYPSGSTTWDLRYTGLAYPTNVAVGEDGKVYIADLVGNKVVVFPKNKTRSLLTIPVSSPQGVTLDAKNNLYVSYMTGNGGRVNEYPPGSTQGKDLGISLLFAGGDAIDASGDLVVADQGVPAVDVFPPGATQPSQQITQSLQDPFRIAFSSDFSQLFVADPEANAVFVYAYPSGTLSNTLTNQLKSVYGVALRREGL